MGNSLQNCCKSKKGETKKKDKTEMNKLMEQLGLAKPEAVPDYIEMYKMEEVFKQFINKEFELKNLVKYVQDENKGIMSMDFLIKVNFTASYWMYVLAERNSKTLVQTRRKALIEKDNKTYKECLQKERKVEKESFESCLWKTREAVQVTPSWWNNTTQLHGRSEEKKKRLNEAQEKGKQMFQGMQIQNLMNHSNLAKMSKREALALQKTLVTVTLDQMREFYENIPLSQQAEEYIMVHPMIRDKFSMRTGIEQEQLETAMYALKMNEDPDFKDMNESMKKAVEQLANEMKANGKMKKD